MATDTKTKNANSIVPTVEEATEQIRNINEKFVDTAKTVGGDWLDTYEKAVRHTADFQTQVANASQVEWVSSFAQTQAKFLNDATAAYTKAARELLK